MGPGSVRSASGFALTVPSYAPALPDNLDDLACTDRSVAVIITIISIGYSNSAARRRNVYYFVPCIEDTDIPRVADLLLAIDRVDSCVSICDVEEVVPWAAVQDVGAEVAEQPVIASPTVYGVVATAASATVAAKLATRDEVVTIGARGRTVTTHGSLEFGCVEEIALRWGHE